MIYCCLGAAVLAAQNGAVLELTGNAPTVHFGELGGSDTLTLIHNSTDDKLTCSGKIQASDVLIEGTSTTVAQMMSRMATLEQELEAVKQFVGIMPPPAMPPLRPPNFPSLGPPASPPSPLSPSPATPPPGHSNNYCKLSIQYKHNHRASRCTEFMALAHAVLFTLL